jgi:hypothetical protein
MVEQTPPKKGGPNTQESSTKLVRWYFSLQKRKGTSRKIQLLLTILISLLVFTVTVLILTYSSFQKTSSTDHTLIVQIIVIAVVIGIACVAAAYRVHYHGKPASVQNPRLGTEVIALFAAAAIILVIVTYFSIEYYVVPENISVDNIPTKQNVNMSVFVIKESTVLIPLKNAYSPHYSHIRVLINHDNKSKIIGVNLSTRSDSVLSINGTGAFVLQNHKLDNSTSNSQLYNGSPISCISQLSSKQCHQAIYTTEMDNYTMDPPLVAYHNYQVNNATKPYTLGIFYVNETDGKLYELPLQFGWSIKTMDLDLLSYFLIVLIGVMASRILTLMLNKLQDMKKKVDDEMKKKVDDEVKKKVDDEKVDLNTKSMENVIRLNLKDYVWVVFSFVIAVLVFSSFSTQVHLTSYILINISLAFGFGFGFDKVLEVSQRFQNLV